MTDKTVTTYSNVEAFLSVFNPRDPRAIPYMANLATKPIVILGNGTQIDRLQSAFWDRLNRIQMQADSEVIVAGVNRIGIAHACLKNRYKPDILATVDAPFFRNKDASDERKEAAWKAAARKEEEATMLALKRTNPKAYEIWDSTRNKNADLEVAAKAAQLGGKVEKVPTATTDAFRRSFATCAGVSTRVVSPQAQWFLQPERVPDKDVVLNMDQSLVGPPDRAHMLFTTADWLTNWFARMGCREFYYYGVSMRDGGHCKTLDLEEDDDFSWSVPSRQSICFRCWEQLREAFPGLKLYNCDRHALFVEKGIMEYKTPAQIDPNYTLLSDEECTRRRDVIMGTAAVALKEAVKRFEEDEQIKKLRAMAEADKRASA